MTVNAKRTSLSASKQTSAKPEPKIERRKSVTPKLRHHKATGQAYVVLNGKAIYFGPFGTDEATEKYHQTIAEWLAAGKQLDQPLDGMTINEIIARFWVHAQTYYVRPDGTQTWELNNFRQALRPLQIL